MALPKFRSDFQFLAVTLSTTQDELKRMILKEGTLRSRQPILVYQDLTLSQLAYISARKVEYPEIEIKQETKRNYPYGDLFAHALGLCRRTDRRTICAKIIS